MLLPFHVSSRNTIDQENEHLLYSSQWLIWQRLQGEYFIENGVGSQAPKLQEVIKSVPLFWVWGKCTYLWFLNLDMITRATLLVGRFEYILEINPEAGLD